MIKNKYVSFISLFCAGIILGSTLAWGFIKYRNSEIKYEYLARRIQIDSPNNIKINFTTLRYEVTDYIKSLGEVSSKVSVYYEYLPTGVSININENNRVVAASLMKLPIVMNLYKASQLGKIDMNKKVALKKELLNSDYGNLYKKGEGYEITLEKAAELTLKDSDNTALLLIWNELNQVKLNDNEQALYYLDIEYDINKDNTVSIGAMSYSSVLKCLYFSCFNNKEDSNRMLEYLSGSSFKDRLMRYLPGDVKVSHKIGTFSEEFQSDCGIVYLPKENYLICIMVEGKEEDSSRIIGDISQKVYLYMLENSKKE